MTLLAAAKLDYIAQLGGIVVTTAEGVHPAQFPELDGWTAVEAVPGLFIKPIGVPGTGESDFFNSRGQQGTHSEKTSIPQASQFTVLQGAILWRQQWVNHGQPFRLEAGQTVWLKPGEVHSYVFLTDCVCTVVITPPLSHHTPRIP